MSNFGKIKSKILHRLIESYTSDKKKDMKDIIKTLKSNEDFKEMYIFYEEIENKYFDDKEVAKLYVEELSDVLKNKFVKISEFCKELNQKLGQIQINENELYDTIDQLSQKDNLNNIDKKVVAKKKLVEHLTTKKEIKESQKVSHTTNENLLYAVLANNFNILYNNSLTTEQKEEFNSIMSLSLSEIEEKSKEVKESLTYRIDTLLKESSDSDLIEKLNKVKEEVSTKTNSRINYLRLRELKNSLD